MKTARLFVLMLTVSCAAHAHSPVSARLDLGGFGWSGTRGLDDQPPLADVQAQARVEIKPTPEFEFVADGIADSNRRALGDRADFGVLREAYAQVESGPVTVQAGAVLIPWGRVDLINPTDSLTARQYTWLTDNDAEQKVAPVGVRTKLHLGGDSLELVVQPGLRGAAVPLPPVAGYRYLDHDRLRGVAGAGRYNHFAEGFCWSLSYFHGPQKRPYLATTPSALALGKLDLVHPVSSVVGADAELTTGPWVLRGEAAYTAAERIGDPSTTQDLSNTLSVLEVEYAIGNNSIFGQAIDRFGQGFHSAASRAPMAAKIGAATDALNDTQRHNQTGMGVGWRYATPDASLASNIDAAWFPDDGGVAIRPRLLYHYSDTLSVSVGADWYAGPDLGTLGRFSKNRVMFLGLKQDWAYP